MAETSLREMPTDPAAQHGPLRLAGRGGSRMERTDERQLRASSGARAGRRSAGALCRRRCGGGTAADGTAVAARLCSCLPGAWATVRRPRMSRRRRCCACGRQARSWDAGRAQASTWLYRVVANLCTDRLRRRRPGPLDEGDAPADPAPGAETRLQTGRAARCAAGGAAAPAGAAAAGGDPAPSSKGWRTPRSPPYWTWASRPSKA